MNNLVFIMYNLGLQRKKEQKKAIIQKSIILEDHPSDDEWITEREEPVLPSDGVWLNVLDRAARRFAREGASRIEEQNNYEDLTSTRRLDKNLEYKEISDDDIEEVKTTVVGSNEFDHVDDFDHTDLGSDEMDDGNLGYED